MYLSVPIPWRSLMVSPYPLELQSRKSSQKSPQFLQLFVKVDSQKKTHGTKMRIFVSALNIPGTQMTSIFEGQPSKTRPFPTKTRVIWVRGMGKIAPTMFCFFPGRTPWVRSQVFWWEETTDRRFSLHFSVSPVSPPESNSIALWALWLSMGPTPSSESWKTRIKNKKPRNGHPNAQCIAYLLYGKCKLGHPKWCFGMAILGIYKSNFWRETLWSSEELTMSWGKLSILSWILVLFWMV